MGFSDQKFYARPLENVAVVAPASLGTITASGTATITAAIVLQEFKRRTKINAVRVYTVGAGNVTGGTILNFLNGTNTFAVCTAVATTGSFADATINANIVTTSTVTNSFSNGSTAVATITTTTTQAILSSNTQPTVTVLAIGTASAQTIGTYAVWMECQEQFDVGAGS